MVLSTRTIVLFISLPIVTVCAGLLYYLHKKDEDWEDLGVITNKTRILEIKVPVEKVPTVIGKNGCTIKDVQQKTNTKINFKENVTDPDAKFKLCRIRGTQLEVEKAEILINDLIYNQPEILTEEMWVPQMACGRIIGKCGENIKYISSQSNASVVVERYTPGKGNSRERQVIIRGTAQEIAVAKSLIAAKVDEEGVFRNTLNSRLPRISTPVKHKQMSSDQKLPENEQLNVEVSDNMIQVYVSSVANPLNFWVQLVSPRSVELDHLVDNMTDYYSQTESLEFHKLSSVTKKQIVAAPFESDNRWYRAQVIDILPNKKKPDGDPVLDIFYVDYGDSSYLELNQVLELRTDFLSLRFQAIECQLAHVKLPKEGVWSEETISTFEDMVHTAQWKRVMVKVVDFVQGNPPKPVVTIFDPIEGFDVGEELIRKGLVERISPLGDEAKSPDLPVKQVDPSPPERQNQNGISSLSDSSLG